MKCSLYTKLSALECDLIHNELIGWYRLGGYSMATNNTTLDRFTLQSAVMEFDKAKCGLGTMFCDIIKMPFYDHYKAIAILKIIHSITV